MTREEFDRKWDHGRLAPKTWSDPRSDEWLQDLAAVEQYEHDYALRSPLPPEQIAAKTGLTADQVRVIRGAH